MTVAIEEIDEPLPEPLPIPELNTAYLGDCIEIMKQWPSEFVDCIVTSPPYYGLRSYLPDGHDSKSMEIGCNQTLDEYLSVLVCVFREARRILKPTGVCWVNLGDSYGKDKQLLGVPWRLAHALQDDGWILRSDVIWYKPNVMPSSVEDRPASSHEYVFMFTKSPRYYFDWYAIKEAWADDRQGRDRGKKNRERNRGGRRDGYTKPNGIDPSGNGGRRPRSVWSIPTVSLNGRKLLSDFKDSCGTYKEIDIACPLHGMQSDDEFRLPLFMTSNLGVTCTCKPVDTDFFAAMPPALAEKCIVASTSNVGNCSVCGTPLVRTLKKVRVATRPGLSVKVDPSGKSHKDPERHVTHTEYMGWSRACACPETEDKSASVVFDPFLGSGTTSVAATTLGRQWLGCELNPMMVDRLIPARLKQALKG